VKRTVAEATQNKRINEKNISSLEEKLIKKMRANGINLSEARAVADLMVNEGIPARHAFKAVRLFEYNAHESEIVAEAHRIATEFVNTGGPARKNSLKSSRDKYNILIGQLREKIKILKIGSRDYNNANSKLTAALRKAEECTSEIHRTEVKMEKSHEIITKYESKTLTAQEASKYVHYMDYDPNQ